MRKPTIHIGGSTARDLLSGYMAASVAVSTAIRSLELAAAPNGRDYYLQGPGSFAGAVDEHRERVARLRSVLTELQELAEHCSDAVCAEEDRKANRRRA
jgi:hypothetical protein